MSTLIDDIAQYLFQVTNYQLDTHEWDSQHLPLFLRTNREYFTGNLLGNGVLLVSIDEGPISVLMKQEKALKQYWDGDVVYVFHSVGARTRQRLIEKRIPFIVLNSQIFLPMFLVDLNERYRTVEKPAALSPAAQVVLLALIQNSLADLTSAVKVARHLGFSKMTVGRALNQLESLNLIVLTKAGRERLIALRRSPLETWKNASEYLRSPVVRRLWLAGSGPTASLRGCEAGLTALALESNLAAPRVPIRAIAKPEIPDTLSAFAVVECSDEADAQFEVWSYNPLILSSGTTPDRLSLYLSLKDDNDERVQQALTIMMSDVVW